MPIRPQVNVAVCGRLHYPNYINLLEERGVLNRFYYAARLSVDGKALGIPQHKAINGFFKEYAVGLHVRLLQDRLQSPFFSLYHDLWQTYVLRHWSRADILHVLLEGNSRLLMDRAQAEGSKTVAEPVNCHPDLYRVIMNEEYQRLGLKRRFSESRLDRRIVREAAACDHLLVASEWLRRSFVAAGVPESRTQVIRYGVDQRSFKPRDGASPPTGARVRRPGPFRVISVAQITPRKGHVYLLQAWRKLRLPDAELLFVGSLAREMKPVLDRYAGSFVQVGHVPQWRLSGYYASSAVFVLASVEDGFGYVCAEAMAAGLPVIATVNTGAAELIEDGVNGFRVPIRSPEILAEKIALLHDDPDLLASMSAAALRTARESLSWERYAGELVDYYTSIHRSA